MKELKIHVDFNKTYSFLHSIIYFIFTYSELIIKKQDTKENTSHGKTLIIKS